MSNHKIINKTKRILLPLSVIIFFLLLMPLAFSEWSQYQNKLTNAGHTGMTEADAGVSNLKEGTEVYNTINQGAAFQPIAIDIDNDGNDELIGSYGTYLRVWDVSSQDFIVENSIWMGTGNTQSSPMTSLGDYDDDGYEEFMAIFGDDVSVFGYESPSDDTNPDYWYKFEDNVFDMMDNQDGTAFGSPVYTTSKMNNGTGNKSILLNGIDEYISLSTIAHWERTDNWSISLWFNVSSEGDMIAKADHIGDKRGWGIYISNTSLAVRIVNDNSPSNRIIILGNTTGLTDNNWHHLVVTYNGNSDESGIVVYIDNQIEGRTIVANTLTGTILNSINTQIGATNGANNLFNGSLDEVTIYDGRILNVANVSHIYNYGINASALEAAVFTKELTQTLRVNTSAVTGIKYDSEAKKAYWANDNGTILEYNLNNDSVGEFQMFGADTFTTRHSVYTSPVLYDIDKEGNNELILMCDTDVNTDEGICVWDTVTHIMDTNFDGDGIIDDFGEADANCDRDAGTSGILVWDDPLVDIEIILSLNCFLDRGAGVNGLNTYLYALDSSGDTIWSVTPYDFAGGGQAAEVSAPVIRRAETTGGTQLNHVCVLSDHSTAAERISCYATESGELIFTHTFPEDTVWNYSFMEAGKANNIPIAANVDRDDYIHEIIVGRKIINIDFPFTGYAVNVLNITPLGGTADITSYSIVADVDGDNLLDVCGQKSEHTFCSFSEFENQLPILLFTPFGITPYSINVPLCNSTTTITFTAKEFGGDWSSDCGNSPYHYSNDLPEDQERLISTCGTSSTTSYGDFKDGQTEAATLDCTYDKIGTYIFDVYLQDNANLNDTSVLDTYTVRVIDGTEGVDCNVPATCNEGEGAYEDITAPEPEDVITSEEDIKDVVEIVTMQSDFVKILLVIIFTVMLIFGIAKYTGARHPLVFASSIFALWMLFAMLGLMSWIYVIIYAIVSIGLAAVMFIKTGARE